MSPDEMITAPYEIWIAPVGTAFPALDEEPSVAWTKLGSNGARSYSDRGVFVGTTRQHETPQPAGNQGPSYSYISAEEYRVRVQLLDMTLDQFANAMGQNSVTIVSGEGGAPGTRTIGLSVDPRVSGALAILARGPSPYDEALQAQYELPRCREVSNPQLIYSKREPTAVAVEFLVLEDPNAASADQLFGRLRTQDNEAFALPVFTAGPSISGNTQVGSILTGSATLDEGAISLIEWLQADSVIAGENAATYTVREADQGELVSVRMTATGAGGNSTATSNPVGPITGLLGPAFMDSFETDGNLNGRDGWVVETLNGFSSQVNDITASGGAAGGTTGTAAYALHEAAVDDVRVEWTLANGANAQQTIVMHASVAGNSAGEIDFLNFQTSQTSSPDSGLVTLRSVLNGTSTVRSNITNTRLENGDTLRVDFSTSADVLSPFLNGRRCGADVDVSFATTSVPQTRKHGLKGNIGASAVEAFTVIDRAAEASIGLYQPNHVVSRNAAGGVTWHLSGDYSGAAPTTLGVEVYDLNGGGNVLIASGNVAALVAESGAWEGTFTASAAQAATDGPYRIEVTRAGLVDGGGNPITQTVYGPRQYPGYAHAGFGQSLVDAQFNIVTAHSGTRNSPTGARWFSGKTTNAAVLGENYTRKTYPARNDTLVAELAASFFEATGETSSWVHSGQGGQTVAALGTAGIFYSALLDGIDHAGGFLNLLHIVHGQADVTTDPATYKAAWLAIAQAVNTYQGGGLKALFHPLAAGWGSAPGTNEQWQNIRKAQWELCQDNPSLFIFGSHTLDVQHADDLHPSSPAGYVECNRRLAWSGAKALGLSATDRNGPSFAGFTKLSNTSVRCIYDLNGADSLQLVNTSYASEFHGGMVFSDAATISSGDIANRIYPTNAVVDGSPSGGQQGITFTIPSVAGTVFAFAGWGKDPFNPNNTAAIQTDMAGKASMIRAVRAGEPSVGLQPYFSASGDYRSAS